MMKIIRLVALSLVLGILLTACSENSGGGTTAAVADKADNSSSGAADHGNIQKPSSPLRYSLGTGSSGGNFYLIGGGATTILNNKLPDYFVITAEETGGSTANLTMIQNGEAEIGIAMTSTLDSSITGEPLDKVRGMVPLYPSYMTMYSLKSANINTLTDLNGRIIGLGSKGAAMDSVLRQAFDEMEIKPSSIYNDGFGATASAVGDGQLDAAVMFSYPPFSSITELEATQDLGFIGLTEEEQKQLTDMFPFYSPDVLPAGSYKGITEDLPVVTEWNMLVGSTDVSQEYGYLLTKTLFESNPELVEIHKSLTHAVPEYCKYFNIPLHAGTVQYLKEIGSDIPAELIPEEYVE